jgi:hypothetical protein
MALQDGKQLDYRGLWTFTYDRANRLKSYTNSNSGGSRGNVWYDSRGKVWQRWNDQVIGGAWDGSLKRYVYDGGQLVQEHLWDVTEDQGSWVYTYNDIDRDYLRHQGGIRQREGTAASYNDFYLQQSGSSIEIKTQRDQASATIARAERTQSLNKMADTTFTDISNLATSNSPVSMYGGGTSGGTAGFDGLVQRGGGRGYLSGLGRAINGGLSWSYGGRAHYSKFEGGGMPLPPRRGNGYESATPLTLGNPPLLFKPNDPNKASKEHIPGSKQDNVNGDTYPLTPDDVSADSGETYDPNCTYGIPELPDDDAGEREPAESMLLLNCCGSHFEWSDLQTTNFSYHDCSASVSGHWIVKDLFGGTEAAYYLMRFCTVHCICDGSCSTRTFLFTSPCPFPDTDQYYTSRFLSCHYNTCHVEYEYDPIYDSLDWIAKLHFRNKCKKLVNVDKNAWNCKDGCAAAKQSDTTYCWYKECPEKGL